MHMKFSSTQVNEPSSVGVILGSAVIFDMIYWGRISMMIQARVQAIRQHSHSSQRLFLSGNNISM